MRAKSGAFDWRYWAGSASSAIIAWRIWDNPLMTFLIAPTLFGVIWRLFGEWEARQ
jgi:hypothetical protein